MPTWAIVILVLSLLVSAVFWSLPWLLKLRGVEMRRHSLFGTVLVFEHADEDGTPVRLLNVNGTFQSASYLSDELWAELVCAYHRTMVDEIDRHGRVRSVLVIGGGGYSLPKYLVAHTKRMEVTVVEIDPKITQVARERFFLAFDVIVNDAFSGARPLGALGNAEGAALIRTHLSKRGMYLANVRTPLEGRKAKVLADVRDAFAREFGSVEVIPERPEEPGVLANNVLVARVEA